MDPRLKRFVNEYAQFMADLYRVMFDDYGPDIEDLKMTSEDADRYTDELLPILKNSKVFEQYVIATLHQGHYFLEDGDTETLLNSLNLNTLDWFSDMFANEFEDKFTTELVREIAKKYPENRTGLVSFITISRFPKLREQFMYEYQKARRDSQKAYGKGSKMTLILRK
jgi:hypothetical protein